MSKKVWLITGAGRGMGVDFARAALASGHSVVASGRDRERVSKVSGTSRDLLAVTLDVTSPADAEAAVRAGVDRFGRIEPGLVFDRITNIDGVPDGYRAMNDREAIKVMIEF